MATEGPIKKSLVEERNEKIELGNILLFNLFGMRSLETTMRKFKVGNEKSEVQASRAKRFTLHRLHRRKFC